MIKRKFCVFFAETHYEVFRGLVKLKEQVNAAVGNHPVGKWSLKPLMGFQFPITVNNLREAVVR